MSNKHPKTDHLKPYQFKAGKEQSKTASKGGKASVKARRKKASLLRSAKIVMEAGIPSKMKTQVEKLTGEIDDENDELFTAATAIMMREALNGNVHAYRELKDIMRMIEDNVTIDETIDDDDISATLEGIARNDIDAS